jgi:uncharacterized membrane protein YphA (DoxX/SURF4 family)
VTGLAYVSALFLAGVFALAGAAKLRDRRGTTPSFRALGLPPGLAKAVPAAELLLAVGLVVLPGWSAAAALAVLAAFTTVLARAVRDGVAVPCNCFGSTSAAPVSAVEIVRNLLLAVVAGVALTADGPRRPSIAAVVLVAVVVVLGRLTLAALRRN